MANFENEYHEYLETFANPTDAEMEEMANYWEAYDSRICGGQF